MSLSILISVCCRKSDDSKADINYAEYLQLDMILNAQQPLSGQQRLIHDEHLFIIIHQSII